MRSINLFVVSFLWIIPNLWAQDFAFPQTNPYSISPFGSRSSPVFVDIDLDGDHDMFTGLVSGDYGYYENIGASNWPSFGSFSLGAFNIGSIGGNATPFFVDLDDDSDFDIMSGGDGGLRYNRNEGNASLAAYFGEIQNPFSILSPTGISKPYLVDIDDDDDFDLFVGSTDGNTYFYENTGTVGNPAFALSITNPFGIANVGERAAPAFADIDNDGDLDLLIGNKQGNLHYFENMGTPSNATFSFIGLNPFNIQGVGDDAKPCFVDMDDDGDQDLMVGNALGDYHYFENVTSLSDFNPVVHANVTIYPNPFKEYTTIHVNGLVKGQYNMIITDVSGRIIFRKNSIETDKIVIYSDIGKGFFFAYLEIPAERILVGKLLVE